MGFEQAPAAREIQIEEHWRPVRFSSLVSEIEAVIGSHRRRQARAIGAALILCTPIPPPLLKPAAELKGMYRLNKLMIQVHMCESLDRHLVNAVNTLARWLKRRHRYFIQATPQGFRSGFEQPSLEYDMLSEDVFNENAGPVRNHEVRSKRERHSHRDEFIALIKAVLEEAGFPLIESEARASGQSLKGQARRPTVNAVIDQLLDRLWEPADGRTTKYDGIQRAWSRGSYLTQEYRNTTDRLLSWLEQEPSHFSKPIWLPDQESRVER